MTERVAIFVDGANAYFAQKEALGWWIDWPKFLTTMRADKDLVSARWYQAYRSEPEVEQERFLHHLTLIGFAVRKRVLRAVFDRTTGTSTLKGDLDMEIAIDALTQSDNFDTAIFVTGDGDFAPLLEALQHRGKRVIVVATVQNIAIELRQQAGVNFIDLRDLQEDIESQKVAPPVREARVEAASNGSSATHPAVKEQEVEDEYDEEEYDDEEEYEDDEEYEDEEEYEENFNFDPGVGDSDPAEAPDPESIELPLEGELVSCHVQTVKRYGAFLDLHQHAKTLLHVKDMNRGFVPDASEFYEVGQEVSVQVVSVDRQKNPPEVRVQVVTPEMEF